MGLNTTVVILNDYTHDIERSADFNKKLAYMLGAGQTGQVIPGVYIIETHHADDTVLVEVGGNIGRRLPAVRVEPPKNKKKHSR